MHCYPNAGLWFPVPPGVRQFVDEVGLLEVMPGCDMDLALAYLPHRCSGDFM